MKTKNVVDMVAVAYALYMSKASECPKNIHISRNNLEGFVRARPEVMSGNRLMGLKIICFETKDKRFDDRIWMD